MNQWENAKKQLSEIKGLVDLPKEIWQKLEKHDGVYEAELKVGGKKYKAFRAQHNRALGPYKGGIRYHPEVSEAEVKALSFWMSVKCAVAGIPMGGGKGGIVVDPKKLSEKELEELSRAWVRAFVDKLGPKKDVPAPDVNTNAKIMGWMVDEYEKQIKGNKQQRMMAKACFTGKPIEIGGSEGREEATGYGGVIILRQLIKELRTKNEWEIPERNQEITVAVQGFGNVGYWLAYHLDRLGFKVVAVSDSKGGIYVKEGLDPKKTLECKQEKGSLAGCYCKGGVCDLKMGKPISNEELLALPVDVLVPAALENAINKDNADLIKAKIVLEMANGPTTPKADEVLNKRNILVVPDVLANAGGVVTSYFEWKQNLAGEKWSKKKVLAKLEKYMERAFEEVWKKFGDGKVKSMRQAAYVQAIERIGKAI